MIFLIIGCGERADYGRIAQDGERVFYGDSITEMCAPELNRGTSGHESADILPEVRHFARRDGKAEYFILIGINDILHGNQGVYLYRMNRIFEALKGGNVNVVSILPTAYNWVNDIVKSQNGGLKALSAIYGFNYIDKYGDIRLEHLSDGVHLTSEGCNALYAR
jgi:lysophospholipase L1-like esterase